MKILLINPPFNRLKGVKSVYFPLGLGAIAGVLDRAGFTVAIYNAENPSEKFPEMSHSMLVEQHHRYVDALADESHYVWAEIYKTIVDYNPDVVGISVLTAKYGAALKVSQLCKKINPKAIVVWGGAHPTVQPNEVLAVPEVDFVVRGEGEYTFLELCQGLCLNHVDFQEIRGLSYKVGGKIINSMPRALIKDLSELPPLAKDLSLYPERYAPANMGDIVTSRGCPFECAFCGAQNVWERKVRYFPVRKAVEEMVAVIHKYGIKQFWFWDDTFTLNRKRTMELCQSIIDKKMDISWGCTTRVDVVDDALLGLMKKAGCNLIEFGIESGSERVLKSIKKNITLPQIMRAVGLVRKHQMDLKLFFMFGFPEETFQDIELTRKLIRDIDARGVVLSVFTPYPGSELYSRVLELGLMPANPEWSRFSHQSPENHFMKHISKQDFQKVVIEMARFVDDYNFSFNNAFQYLLSHRQDVFRSPVDIFLKSLSFLKRKIKRIAG